ncbi:MAG: glycosyltransferase [Candidatus Paceibacterota bacterium]
MTKDKKKVAIVMNDFIVGGVQKLAVDQMNLLKGEFDFVLITLMQFPRGDFYHLVPEGVKVYKLNFKGFFDIRSLIKLTRILIKEKPQIVKTAMFLSNTIIRVLKIFFGFVVITAEHNTETKRPASHRFLNKLLSKLTYTIIADSNTVADHVSHVEKIPRSKFTVIYNGVEINEIEKSKKEFSEKREEIRKEISASENELVFLTVARLVIQKNHDLMIRGFTKYLTKGGIGKLVIIGDGILMNELKKLSKDLNVENSVIFLGERQDIYRFYAVSDFFLLTSLREGFCISAMNGLAFGLPLISTRVAGVVEYLKDGKNGYFFDDTEESVSDTLIKVSSLSDSDLNKMKTNAEETSKDFSVEVHAEKYRKLFNECLKK